MGWVEDNIFNSSHNEKSRVVHQYYKITNKLLQIKTYNDDTQTESLNSLTDPFSISTLHLPQSQSRLF